MGKDESIKIKRAQAAKGILVIETVPVRIDYHRNSLDTVAARDNAQGLGYRSSTQLNQRTTRFSVPNSML